MGAGPVVRRAARRGNGPVAPVAPGVTHPVTKIALFPQQQVVLVGERRYSVALASVH